MGQFSVETYSGPGSLLSDNQQDIFDRLPLPAAFDKQAHVLSTRLSDDGEVGGLFGFRFD